MNPSAEPGAVVRWGLLGTAMVARTSFLPGLVEAGGGVAQAVGSRDGERARAWAAENGVQRGVEGYEEVLEDPSVDAVYVALPNTMHAQWTAAALQNGKAVLCEKPLCVDVAEAEQVLAVARASGRPLWEAFAFPFHEQTERLLRLLEADAVGEVRELEAHFHFVLEAAEDIRWRSELGGGALYDVGCYPVRLARCVFGAEPEQAEAEAVVAPSGVDVETAGVLAFPDARRLVFSCGFRADRGTTRVVGSEGEIRLGNAFHPRAGVTLELWRAGKLEDRHVAEGDVQAFTPLLRHVHAALLEGVAPRHPAVEDALGTARALQMLRAAAGLDGARGVRPSP